MGLLGGFPGYVALVMDPACDPSQGEQDHRSAGELQVQSRHQRRGREPKRPIIFSPTAFRTGGGGGEALGAGYQLRAPQALQ